MEQKVPKPQPPMGGRGGGHPTAQALPTSPKQVTRQPTGLRKCLFKARWLCPATRAEPIHQLSRRLPGRVSAGLALSARLEASNAGRQGWGLGEALGGTVCATVMDDTNRDGIPGIFIPFHTSGKLFNQSSCKASVTGALEFFRETLGLDHRNPGWGTRSLRERRFSSACYSLEAKRMEFHETETHRGLQGL